MYSRNWYINNMTEKASSVDLELQGMGEDVAQILFVFR